MKIGQGERKIDYLLALTVLMLVLLGIVILSSVSAVFSQEKTGSSVSILFRQLMVGLGPGILLGAAVYKMPLSFFRKSALVLLLANLILAVLVFFPVVGLSLGGASRWINLGFFSFQPSEFLKMTFILYLAAWLSARLSSRSSKSWRRASGPECKKLGWQSIFSKTFIGFLAIVGIISGLLILQPDISTLGILAGVAAIMYFLAETPLWHTIFLGLTGLTGLLILIKIAPYRFNRFLIFINPNLDPMGLGYQIKQALIAVGSGGLFGVGLGMSIQKMGFLPQPMTDSVFAIFSEETGFLGSLVLVFLFLAFTWRGFETAKKAPDSFSRLTAAGITCWIAIQGFINIGSIIGLLPLTGIPLPFISYGGSAMAAELIGVGMLLNISKNRKTL
jgi:cell division protein FtsW